MPETNEVTYTVTVSYDGDPEPLSNIPDLIEESIVDVICHYETNGDSVQVTVTNQADER
ncbi:MAG: hypothetical protein ACRCZS_19295 [Chroococcidiopsis sp.]